jgi:hypothetical protein
MTEAQARKKQAAEILAAIKAAEEMYMPGTYEYQQVVAAALVYRVHNIKWILRHAAGQRH